MFRKWISNFTHVKQRGVIIQRKIEQPVWVSNDIRYKPIPPVLSLIYPANMPYRICIAHLPYMTLFLSYIYQSTLQFPRRNAAGMVLFWSGLAPGSYKYCIVTGVATVTSQWHEPSLWGPERNARDAIARPSNANSWQSGLSFD